MTFAEPARAPQPLTTLTQGLRVNRTQFLLLLLINALVGGMVGLERTIVPLLGAAEFAVRSELLLFTFIIAFGVIKACTNLAAGPLLRHFTRKSLLVAGWAAAVPVPFMLGWGGTWTWIVIANLLLGISQGLAWSMTVLMKIDLAGPLRRGLAVGLNEFAGYGALGLTAWLTGYIAERYGLRPAPFLIGIAYALSGLALSLVFVRDTSGHARLESSGLSSFVSRLSSSGPKTGDERPETALLGRVFAAMSVRDRNLTSLCQAGLVTNLNDGMSWGVFPLLFAAHGLTIGEIGIIKALYPLTWSVVQIGTGMLSDRLGRKPFIVAGMLLQAAAQAIVSLGIASPWLAGVTGAVLLGFGTALVYPVLLAAVADATTPAVRPVALGVYRFWRDLGYAIGALLAGLVAVRFGLLWTVHVSAFLTLLSGLLAWIALPRSVPASGFRLQALGQTGRKP